MKTAIMQPYLFPYIGYFQLMNAVDTFMIYDDVQFTKRGFMNRNKILVNQEEHLFTFSVNKAPRNYYINQRYYTENFYYEVESFLKTLERNYKQSPQFETVYPIIKEALNVNIKKYDVAKVNEHTLKTLNNYMGIKTNLVRSSKFEKPADLKGQDKILYLNKQIRSNQYINPIGGRELYSSQDFKREGIELSFIKTNNLSYKQFGNSFVPNLSIIDVLMFNDINQLHNLLNQYHLLNV